MNFNLDQPYPLKESKKWRLINSFLFGCFVFIFLLIFQPFGINKLSKHITLIALGYGVVCFAIMAALNLVVYSAFPNLFLDTKWTTKKEIIWTVLNVFIIGFGNYIYSILIKIIAFDWWNLFVFETYTIAVGIFPLTLSILINQVRLNKKFERQSAVLSKEIEKEQKKRIADAFPLNVVLENGNDQFELTIEKFLFAQADDNYIKIYYLSNAKVARKIIRNTLKNIYSLFSGHNNILKCHKSYIVNLKNVHRISGNAQGYKLHLKGTEKTVPVSRTLNETIKQYFADSH